MPALTKSSRLPRLAGIALAATGLAHFAKPQLFESITAPAFPERTSAHIFTNGGIETAIGIALIVPQTRRLAAIGGIGYLVYLGANAARNAL